MAAGRRARNPRRELVPHLQMVARQVRNRIGQWRPDSGLIKAAKEGKEVYPERDPEQWDDIAALGRFLADKGAEIEQYALEQKRLLLESPAAAPEPEQPPVVKLSQPQYEALDAASPVGSIKWVAGGTKHILYKLGLVTQLAGQRDRWYVGVTDKGHAAMRAYQQAHPEVIRT